MPRFNWYSVLKEVPKRERRSNIPLLRKLSTNIRSIPERENVLTVFREKMATLKYYSVDSDGKIQRLRRECPSETCGAGIFMAFHKDRQYCGKCHTTCTFHLSKRC